MKLVKVNNADNETPLDVFNDFAEAAIEVGFGARNLTRFGSRMEEHVSSATFTDDDSDELFLVMHCDEKPQSLFIRRYVPAEWVNDGGEVAAEVRMVEE